MKKLIIPILAMALLFAASCKKDNPNPNAATLSTWTFKGASYSGDTCQLNNGYFEAWVNGNATSNYVYISFPDNALPSAGQYKVVTYPVFYSATVPVAVVNFIGASSGYVSTGFGSNQTLTVTVSAANKVTVNGTGIMLSNTSGDSSTINLNMIQTF